MAGVRGEDVAPCPPASLLSPPAGSLGGTGSRLLPTECEAREGWGCPWRVAGPGQHTDLWRGSRAAQGRQRRSVLGAPAHGRSRSTAGPAGLRRPAGRARPGPAPAPGCGPGGRLRPGGPGGRQPRRWPAAASWWHRAARPGGSAPPPDPAGGAAPAPSPGPRRRPPPLPASAAASGPAGAVRARAGASSQTQPPLKTRPASRLGPSVARHSWGPTAQLPANARQWGHPSSGHARQDPRARPGRQPYANPGQTATATGCPLPWPGPRHARLPCPQPAGSVSS